MPFPLDPRPPTLDLDPRPRPSTSTLPSTFRSLDLLTNMVDVALIELEGVVFDTRGLRYESLREALAAQSVFADVDRDAVAGLATRESVVVALRQAKLAADDVLVDLIT